MYHLGRGERDSEIQNARFCFYNNSYFNEIIFCLSFYIVLSLKSVKYIYNLFEKGNINEIKTNDDRCLHVAALFVTQSSKKAIVNGSNIPEPLLMMF